MPIKGSGPSVEAGPVSARGPQAEFKHERLHSLSKYKKGSFKTVKEGRHRIVVAKPHGSDKMEAQAVLHPKGEREPRGRGHGAHSPENAAKGAAIFVGILIVLGWFFVGAGYAAGTTSKPSGWNSLNPLAWLQYNASESAFGWAQQQVTPKFVIGGGERWFVEWEIASMVIGTVLLIVGLAFTHGIIKLLAVVHGLIFLGLPIWGLFSGL